MFSILKLTTTVAVRSTRDWDRRHGWGYFNVKIADYSPVISPSLDKQEDALQKGLGRAVQWAMAGRLNEDLLLDACLHDKRYDRGFNEVRGHWLWPIMQAIHLEDRFRPAILEALNDLVGDDALQLCELGFHYAEKGDDEFRSRLYELVREKPFADARYLGEEEIIRLDGDEAFLLAVRVRGSQLTGRNWDWDDSALMQKTVERLGEERVSSLLETAADEAVQRFRDRWQQEKDNAERQDESEQTQSGQTTLTGVSEIISAIESELRNRVTLRTWGRRARDEDLETVLQYLLSARNPKFIANGLWVFSARQFPRILPELVDLCHHRNDHVRRGAFVALEDNTHPLVRQLAEEELQNGVPDGLALGLFIKNYQPGDEQHILNFTELPGSNDQMHEVLMDVVKVCEENEQADCSQLGVVAYALQPCGMCRGRAAELLQKRNAAPSWLIDECGFDSEEDTRKLATMPTQIK
jgi:hypothetical protein